MSFLTDIMQSASGGIVSIFEHPITFVLFVGFLLWTSINDLKTMTVRDYQNASFFLVGFVLFGLSSLGIWETGLSLGWQHFIGAVVGFLLLFIPGMILNYAFGGDIKFATAMGFWIGPSAIILIMVLATIIQLLILIGKAIMTKSFSMKNSFPFAPAFALAYFMALGILLIL